MKNSKRQAVTLMELIVVIIIIGILVSVMVPQYGRSRERAMDKQAKSILSSIRTAERMRWVENGTYYTPGAVSVEQINDVLSLSIVTGYDWDSYTITSQQGFNASMHRDKANYSRTWWITAYDENASCTGNCP